VFNVQICAVAAGGAFLLSSLAGLIGGADFFTVLIRALVFSALAFGFTAGAQQLISQFLPELIHGAAGLDAPGEEVSADENRGDQIRMGEKVDVSVGDEGEEDLREYVAPAEGEDEGFLPASGLDQGTEGGYTEVEQPSKPAAAVARPPELVGDVDVLPDLDGFSDSFITPISVDGTAERVESRSSGSSAATSAADGKFDAKEMAMAIQTILKRDQKG
jgi:hypothetical protein